MKTFLERLNAGEVLVADGATGTNLHAMGLKGGTDYPLFACNDPTLSGQFFGYMPFLRRYWRAVKDAVDGPLLAQEVNPRIDQVHTAFLNNSAAAGDPSSVKTWISDRRTWLLGQLASVAAAFAITTHAGTNFSSSTNMVVIEGTAPVDVDAITVNGYTYPVTWTAVTAWSVSVGLQPGPNLFEFKGIDPKGLALNGMTDSVVVTYTGSDILPPPQLVINEIMYNPAAQNAEFIELYNASYAPAALSNYFLEGVKYAFVTNILVGPDGYVVLAQDEAAFHAAYGADIPVAGQYVGKLSNSGEALRLWHTNPVDGVCTLVDTVTYSPLAPWPVAANGTGPSLQLINPFDDNNRVANWAVGTAVPYTPGKRNNVGAGVTSLPAVWINEVQTRNATTITDRFGHADPWIELLATAAPAAVTSSVTVVPAGSVWKYLDNGSDQGSAWQAPGFDDAAWASGPARLGYGGDGEVTLLSYGSNATNKYPCTYFRHAFVVGSTADVVSLTLELVRDDGAVVYLNGVEIRRDHMNPGTPNYLEYANATVSGSEETTWYPTYLDPSVLRIGTNVLAVEIHQCAPTSSDIGLDLRITAVRLTSVSSLAGYYLSDDPASLCKWPFPADATLPANTYRIVWMDGAAGESVSNEVHTSFRLDDGEVLCLSRVANGRTTVVDYVTDTVAGLDRSIGCLPNGVAASRQLLFMPTPGAPNIASNPAWHVYLNEWMADNKTTIADPADGQYNDWFELYNADAKPVDLGGFLVGDANTTWPIPPGTVIGSNGFLLVWADTLTNNNMVGSDLHAPFKLGKSGDELHLAIPGGTELDGVVFGTQRTDITEGRYPDGTGMVSTLWPPTPRGPNSLPEPVCALCAALAALAWRRGR